MKCNQYQTEMIKDCGVNVEGVMYGIKSESRRNFKKNEEKEKYL